MSELPVPVSKSPWRSLTLQGAAAMALAYVAGRAGIVLPDGLVTPIADALVDLVFTLGVMAVSLGRARARAPLS